MQFEWQNQLGIDSSDPLLVVVSTGWPNEFLKNAKNVVTDLIVKMNKELKLSKKSKKSFVITVIKNCPK
jgi:hypothetical protein